jgi:hypothetical protein
MTRTRYSRKLGLVVARRLVGAAACVLLLCLAPIHAAGPDPVPPPEDLPRTVKAPAQPPLNDSSLDDALLNELDNELLEEVGEMPRPAQPKHGAAARQGDSDATETIDDMQPGEHDDPLVHISQEMRMVEEFLPQAARRGHAEQLQRRIVDDLARLIAQAEAQQAQQSSSSKQQKSKTTSERKKVQQPKQAQGQAGKDSNEPAQDSSNRLGNAQAARPDPELFKRMMKDTWGHLPARDREQMLQTTPDKFLPQYELMIEKYYKRLAEEPRSP